MAEYEGAGYGLGALLGALLTPVIGKGVEAIGHAVGYETPEERADKRKIAEEKRGEERDIRKEARAKATTEAEEEALGQTYGPVFQMLGMQVPQRPTKIYAPQTGAEPGEMPGIDVVPGKPYVPKSAVSGLSEVTRLLAGEKPTKESYEIAAAKEAAGPGATPAKIGNVLAERDVTQKGKIAAEKKQETLDVLDLQPAPAYMLNRETLMPFIGTTGQAKVAQAIDARTVAKHIDALTKLRTLQNDTMTLKVNAARANMWGDDESWTGRTYQYGKNLVLGYTSTEVRNYNAFKEGLLGPYARGIAAEVGVLTEGDVRRIRAMLPNESDTAKGAAQKLATIDLIINSAMEAQAEVIRGNVSGYTNTSAYRKELEARLAHIELIHKAGRVGVDEGPTPIVPVKTDADLSKKYKR